MRRRRLIAIGLTFVLALAACGSPQSQPADREQSRLAKAAAASQDAGAFRVVMRGKSEMPGFSKPMRMSGFGLVDPATERVRLVMNMGKFPPLGDLGTMEAVGDGLIMYMKWDFMSSLSGSRLKPWLKMDLEALGEELGFDMGALMQASGHDPSQMLGYLHGVSDVETVGTETVQGYETTHYRTDIDLRDAAEAAPPELRDRVASSIDRLIELTGVESMPMEVWVDDSDLVRRMKYTIDFTEMDPSLGTPGMKMTDTTDIVEYGIRARIRIPPPSQVTDVMKLIGEDLGGTSIE